MGEPNCKMCSHESACAAWKRHGKALNNGFDYVAEHCPHRLLNIASDASTVRLIDANEILKRDEYCDCPSCEGGGLCGFRYIPIEVVEKAQTIDAVPVVRCKDCKKFTPCIEVIGKSWTGFCEGLQCHTDEEDFCSRGERREENATD